MTKEERFLITAHAEGGQSVSVAGSTYRASAMAITPRVSARTAVVIIRGTTRIAAPIKAALTEAVDRLREELSEPLPIAKRVRRFVNTLADISPSAADAVRDCESIRTLLSARFHVDPYLSASPALRTKIKNLRKPTTLVASGVGCGY